MAPTDIFELPCYFQDRGRVIFISILKPPLNYNVQYIYLNIKVCAMTIASTESRLPP